eukprot:4035308-Pleurochrysis_carterae.AAC.1
MTTTYLLQRSTATCCSVFTPRRLTFASDVLPPPKSYKDIDDSPNKEELLCSVYRRLQGESINK